jgi:hypothetical protein
LEVSVLLSEKDTLGRNDKSLNLPSLSTVELFNCIN